MNSKSHTATRTMRKPGIIRPYSITELSSLYGVSNRTMRNWIKSHSPSVGDRVGRFYTTSQVKKIFEKLGLP